MRGAGWLAIVAVILLVIAIFPDAFLKLAEWLASLVR
jgi:hypothetical protein